MRNCYSSADEIEVVVLDFDLSWHKGAMDLSVVHGARAQGYAAPEQTSIRPDKDANTRTTAVDVFGYGMVAYFVLTGKDPRPNEHNFPNFKREIIKVINSNFSFKWKSLPEFLSSIICSCTADTQKDRISLGDARRGFQLARDLELSDNAIDAKPLVLSEIAYFLNPDVDLTTILEKEQVCIVSLDGTIEIHLSLKSGAKGTVVSMRMSKTQGEADHRNIHKYLDTARSRALAILKSVPFSDVSATLGRGRIDINGFINLPGKIPKSFIGDVATKISDTRAAISIM